MNPKVKSQRRQNIRYRIRRKIAGTTKPSKANQDAFDQAVAEIAHSTRHLLDALVTTAPPKNREEEAEKKRARAVASGRYA